MPPFRLLHSSAFSGWFLKMWVYRSDGRTRNGLDVCRQCRRTAPCDYGPGGLSGEASSAKSLTLYAPLPLASQLSVFRMVSENVGLPIRRSHTERAGRLPTMPTDCAV